MAAWKTRFESRKDEEAEARPAVVSAIDVLGISGMKGK
jgi:hypothetical protein